MAREDSSTKHRAVLAAVSLMFSLVFPAPRLSSKATISISLVTVESAESQPPQKPIGKTRAKPRIDYSSFSHRTHVVNQKMACDSCHKFPTNNWKEVRKGDAAFPDIAEFPDHSSCLNCHRPQFFARERPAPAICSNCHVNVTPRDTTRFLFPSLGDVGDSAKPKRDVATEFAVNFPHDKHVDVVGLNDPGLRPASRVGFVTVSWQQKSAPQQS